MENINKPPVLFMNKKVADTNLEKLQKVIERKHNIKFESYWDLYEWSIQNYATFIEELWHFFEVISSEPYKKVWVKTGPGFLDNEWFSGSKLNYAENMLRLRDDTIALICLDELGNEEIITYAEMYEEVKRYSAAFRKNGLKKGDRVACIMSNRKEAIFAMLASASIGAIWGGPILYYGAQAAAEIVSMMEPKFLISIDSYQYDGLTYPTLDNLLEIVNEASTLEKVILVVTQEETRKKDLSKIRNCIFLEDFLQEGLNSDGTVPEIIFEQLPFDYPLCINFTSGTTGLPKPLVHSIGSMLGLMQDHSIAHNLRKGDVVLLNSPVGWHLWESHVACLGLGLTLFLHCSSLYYSINGKNLWELAAKYQCTKVVIPCSMADKMEKLNIIPRKGTDMSCIKVITMRSSPVKNHNLEYIRNKVTKDAFVVIAYCATELFGSFSGFNMNMPVYSGEIQTPTLGLDLKCFDAQGKSVVGKCGEAVLCNPVFNLPTHLWKDENKTKITDIYLKKFPGVWAQHDECWINPKTKGLIVIGRSDDTLKQKGCRYGAADVYCAINSMNELQDYLCVSQLKNNGDCRSILFVKMRPGLKLTSEIKTEIEQKVDEALFEECIPELILEIPDIPYNLNNKRMESLVRKIIAMNEIPEVKNIRNPESLKHYINIPEILSSNA